MYCWCEFDYIDLDIIEFVVNIYEKYMIIVVGDVSEMFLLEVVNGWL